MTQRLVSWTNPWFTTAIAACGASVLLAGVLGFAVLPELQGGTGSLWNRICSAAGFSTVQPGANAVIMSGFTTTAFVTMPVVPGSAQAASIGHGATLAIRCAMCHGARGVSAADTPNLAGQYPAVLYKQLRDYASGARTNAIMGPRVTNLTDADLRDLASYYAYLPRLPSDHPPTARPAPFIVASGAPMRNIPPCAACHAANTWLEGEPFNYLRSQLQAFASGARHNDISQRMRNVARGMSETEIASASRYYAQAE